MATAEWRAAMEEVRRTAAAQAAKTDEAREETARAAEGTRQAAEKAGLSADGERGQSGSWSLKELTGLLGDSDYEARTANASETSVRLQQETNRYLKKMASETLTYGG